MRRLSRARCKHGHQQPTKYKLPTAGLLLAC